MTSIFRYIILLSVAAYVVSDDSHWLHECSLFNSNQQLLEYALNPFSWNDLVVPLATRCDARKFGDKYLHIEDRPKNGSDVPKEKNRPKVLVCHDMAGNYRGDRFVQGSTKFDDYRFYHWAGIDYFNYFSHNYITIPPLPWINAGHRHGVPILGTIIIEFDNAKKLIDELLRSRHDLNIYIEAFVLVTKNFGFDGWLLNIETDVELAQVVLLKEFVRQLTKRIHEEIPNGVVIWYDSVIEYGLLRHQNEVNDYNIDMYRNTDGILLNYWWDVSHLRRTVGKLQNDPEELAKVFVGVDVFGRGKSIGFGKVVGNVGGFETHRNLGPIEHYNLSTGIFAPGWTFEAIPNEHPTEGDVGTDGVNIQFLERNTRFWTRLWNHLYLRGPNTLPFYTTFCLGSGKRLYRDGTEVKGSKPWFNLMKQQFQPSVPSSYVYNFEESYDGGSSIQFVEPVHNVRLFVTDFPCKDNLVASFVYKRSSPEMNVQLVLYVESENADDNLLIYCNADDVRNVLIRPQERVVSPLKSNLLKYTVAGLSNRHEKVFPSRNRPINGWETRYFYLNFDEIAKHGRVTDIGITINKNDWDETDSLLLGALHIQSGIRDDQPLTNALPTISFSADNRQQERTRFSI